MIKWIHRFEDGLLAVLLLSMILLASGQIALRNFFDLGVVWIDPALRLLVLWTGMIGATVASRDNRHIRIDLMSKLLSKKTHLFIQVGVGLFTTFICAVIAWYGATWVIADYQDNLPGIQGIPAWMLEIIIPAAFGLIAIRYLSLTLSWIHMLYTRSFETFD